MPPFTTSRYSFIHLFTQPSQRSQLFHPPLSPSPSLIKKITNHPSSLPPPSILTHIPAPPPKSNSNPNPKSSTHLLNSFRSTSSPSSIPTSSSRQQATPCLLTGDNNSNDYDYTHCTALHRTAQHSTHSTAWYSNEVRWGEVKWGVRC